MVEASEIAKDFVRIDCLRPGDVILMRGKNVGSYLISIPTLGKYSHAALVINHKNGLCVFDSDVKGIGVLAINTTASGVVNGNRVNLLALPNTPTLSIFRHPLLEMLDPMEIERVTALAVDAYNGLQYTRHERLSNAFGWLSFLRPFAAPLLRLVDRRRYPNGVYGPFCSELVAIFFGMLRIHLFDQAILPEMVSPNDLQRSRLINVEGALISREEISSLIWFGHYGRNIQDVWRQFFTQSKTLKNRIDEYKEDTRLSTERLVQAGMIDSKDDHKRFIDSIALAVRLHKHRCANILEKFQTEHVIALKHLLSFIRLDENKQEKIADACNLAGRLATLSSILTLILWRLSIHGNIEDLKELELNISASDLQKLRKLKHDITNDKIRFKEAKKLLSTTHSDSAEPSQADSATSESLD